MDPALLDYTVLAPLGFTSIGAMLVLVVEALLGGAREAPARTRASAMMAGLASISLMLAIYAAAWMFWTGSESVFNPRHPMMELDPLSTFSITLVGTASLLSIWLSITYLPAIHIDHGEYYALMLLSTAGAFVLVTSVDLISLYLGLELMSLPLYALAGFDVRRLRSNESALKYFVIGSFASTVLLYGAALLYGATGSTGFEGLRAGFDAGGPLAIAGLALVIVGFAFKVMAVPFHQWGPDVYEGAPTSVTAFMAATVKTAAVVVLLRFLVLALPESSQRLDALLWLMAVATKVVGNVMAIIQSNVKRMLAYSSIAHAGYLLVGVAVGTHEAWAAILFYLFVYLFTVLGAFGVLIALAQGGREREAIEDFAGLASRRPAMAAGMTLFLLSLAGLPGTAGFMAKFYLFLAAVDANQIVLAIVGALTSVVSLFYYLRIPMVMYMREPREGRGPEVSSSEIFVLVICATVVLYFAFFPQSDPWGIGFRALDLAERAVAFLP